MTIFVSILTISDRASRQQRPDKSGPALAELVVGNGWSVVRTAVIPDEYDQIVQILTEWSDPGIADIILTTGGTGFAPRDITPEATQAVLQKITPGISEYMRIESLKITPHAMLSRGTAGIRNKTLIINLPGSPKAAVENLNIILPILPHAVELLHDSAKVEAGHHFNAKINYSAKE
jgi:molybdopterin adenylyltransferase